MKLSLPRRLFLAAILLVVLPFPVPLEAGENSWTHVPFVDRPPAPRHLLATSDSDVFFWFDFNWTLRTEDGGRRFEKLETPSNATGTTVDPHDPSLLFLFAGSHLQRSTDAGHSWLPVLPAPSGALSQAVPSLHQAGRIYALVQEVLWRSDDGGATFGRRGALPGGDDQPIVHLEEAADGQLYLLRSAVCIYHSCGSALSAYRSADQGASWQSIFAGNGFPQLSQLLTHPTRPEILFLRYGFPNPEGPALWRSDDRGATFTRVGPAPDGLLVADATRPEVLLAIRDSGVSRSRDLGVGWEGVEVPLGPGEWHSNFRATFAGGRLRAVAEPAAGEDLFFVESSDLGETWTEIRPAGLFPGGAAALTAGAVPGLFYCSPAQSRLATSWNGGSTWTHRDLPAGLDLLAADPREAGVLYARRFENFSSTVYRSADGGATFLPISPPFYGYIADFKAFPFAGVTALVAVTGDGAMTHSPDGQTWSELERPPGSGPFSPQWRFVLVDGAVLYAITDHAEVYRSTDGGAHWEKRSEGHYYARAGGGLLAELDPYEREVEISDDGGLTWESRPLPFSPWQFAAAGIQVDKAGGLYLVHDRAMILRSRDRGRTWQALTQDLPDYGFEPSLVADPFDQDHLLLASPVGLYQASFHDREALALFGGRFEARLRWRGGAGGWVGASGATLGDESGYFRLFTPDRAEVFVTVADRRPENGHFEVALAALTDVELELEVKDRQTGEIFVRSNAAGAAASWSEPAAFPQSGPQFTAGVLPRLEVDIPVNGPIATLGNRFEISVSAYAAGELRVGDGRPVLGDSAAFSLLPNGASEVFVNLVDGRAWNGRIWLFGASFTDLAFTVTVRDRSTGEVRFYSQPGGAPAAFSDLGAF